MGREAHSSKSGQETIGYVGRSLEDMDCDGAGRGKP